MVTPEQQSWIGRVLGVDPDADADVPAFPKGMMAERLQIITEDARRAGLLEEIGGALKKAAQAVKDEAPNAGDLLNALEDAIAESANARRREQVRGEVDRATLSTTAGLVGMAQLRLRLLALRGSYDAAAVNLEDACLALLKTPDFIDDPRSAMQETLDAIKGIGDRVPDVRMLVAYVESVLDEIANDADPGNRAVLVADILGEIDSYRAKLDEEPFLKTMESTPAGGFAIYSAMAGAIDELATALRA